MNEKQASVAARIAELSSLPIAELWPVWDRYFSSRPINPNRVFIESRIAYKMQEEAFGGLAHNTRQRLEAIGAKHSKIKLRARPRDINFAPGTVLLREWGDREHKVAVTAEGLFEYEGSTLKSLTAVARHRRAHPRQDRRQQTQRDVDGWRAAARLRRREPSAGHQRRGGGGGAANL